MKKALKKEMKKLQINKNEPEQVTLDKKLMFPVILFCPAFDQDPSDKVIIVVSLVDCVILRRR